jgi:outer membrane protein TolC
MGLHDVPPMKSGGRRMCPITIMERSVMPRLGHHLVCFSLIAVGACSVAYGQSPPTTTGTLKLRTIPKAQPISLQPNAKAEPEKSTPPLWEPVGTPHTLGMCLAIGAERQPAIHAAVASLAASERGYLALMGLRNVAEFFSPDLPVRRMQSQRGIAAAVAEVNKARQENIYDITSLYFKYVYATQQEQTASEIVQQMEAFYAAAVEILKSEKIDPKIKINDFTLAKLDDIIGEVKQLQRTATIGRKQALDALKEAMGVDQSYSISISLKELPTMSGELTKATAISQALATRPELVQAEVIVDVTRQEICAQSLLKYRSTAQTFANGADLHARLLPAPVRTDTEYRPGAVPPEMPSQLAGKMTDRVARTQEYLRRQEAVRDKVVGLIQLEASTAYLKYETTIEQVKEAKERHERAQILVEKSRTAAITKMDPELLIQNESLASKAQARYVEAVHTQLQALVMLEKVTGGAFRPSYPGR